MILEYIINPLSAGISTVFGLIRLLEGRVLHKGAWVFTLLATLLGVQDYKKVKFLPTALKGLRRKQYQNSNTTHLPNIISKYQLIIASIPYNTNKFHMREVSFYLIYHREESEMCFFHMSER